MATANTKRDESKCSDDLYNTPLDALEAAFAEGVFDEFDIYYDPCNGLGKISNFLESKGKTVYRSDINDYGCQDNVIDFFKVDEVPEDTQCIVFNPPFKLTEEFIDHALSICDNLIMFNRATVLESKNRSKKHLSKWPLEKFWSFANRVSCTKGVNEEKTNNAVWYGFFKYSYYHRGQPSIGWLFTNKGEKK